MTRTDARIAVLSMPLAAALLALLSGGGRRGSAHGPLAVDEAVAVAIGGLGSAAALYLSLGALALAGAKNGRRRNLAARLVPSG